MEQGIRDNSSILRDGCTGNCYVISSLDSRSSLLTSSEMKSTTLIVKGRLGTASVQISVDKVLKSAMNFIK